MMGSEQEGEQHRLYSPEDSMESLVLDQSPRDRSRGSPFLESDYRSAMSNSVGEDAHPLAPSRLDFAAHKSFKDPSYRKSFMDSSSGKGFQDDLLVEPPSYADAIFRPSYMGEASGNGSAREVGVSSPSRDHSSSSEEMLSVAVTQPQKAQDGGGSLVPGAGTYVTYLIVTRTNIPEYRGTDFSVRRRFRDVVTLADRLADAFRGYFIPPRPDKSIVESQVMQKQEFIEQRRVALEKYLGRLAQHPVLRRSDELRLFLQFQGKLPLTPTTDMASRMLDGAVKLPRQLFGEGSTMLAPHDVAQPAKQGRDLVRLFKELKQSVTNDWSSTKPAVFEEDKGFIEKKEKLLDLERHLGEASQQAEALVKTQQEVGEVMGEMGLAFIKLAKFETEEATSDTQRVNAANVKRMATAAVKASRFYRESTAQSVKHLDQLHEQLGFMQALHAAFADRSNALLTVQTLTSDLVSLNTRVEKLKAASSKVFGGDKSRIRKVEELKETLKVVEESKDCAQREYDSIKEHNRTELERFEEDRRHDSLDMLRGFVHTAIAYHEKMASVWSKAVEEGAGTHSFRSSDGSSSSSSLAG